MKSKKLEIKEFLHETNEIFNIEGISKECYNDLFPFLELINECSLTACKETHYENLNEYLHSIFNYIHDRLDKYKFENGKPEVNIKNINASFWWSIYKIMSDIIYSPNLKTNVASHHSSAWERNEALKVEIEHIVCNYYRSVVP